VINTVVKSSTQTKTSDAAFADDSELSFTTAANTTYRIKVLLDVEAHNTPDFKWRLNHTGTTTRFLGVVDQSNTTGTATSRTAGPYTAADLAAGTANAMNGSAAAGLHGNVQCDCVIQVGASGGTFSVQWAQNTSNGNITQVFEYSSITWEDLTPGSRIIIKSADETISSDGTLGDDSQLVAPLEINADYLVELMAVYTSGATPDFQYALAFSGTLSSAMGRLAHRATQAAVGNAGAYTEPVDTFFTGTEMGDAWVINGSATGTDRGYTHFRGVVRVGAGAGNLSFQWAQNTSNASNTTVTAGSYLIAERV
jgi:hypothetical protein